MGALGTQGRAEIVKHVTDRGKLLAVSNRVTPTCEGEGSLSFYNAGE
jgi:hypothetical protein